MTAFTYPSIDVSPDDPHLKEKLETYSLEVYRIRMAELCERALNKASEPPPPPRRDHNTGVHFHLGLDNLPEEYIEDEQFLFLTESYYDLCDWIDKPKPATNDPILACSVMAREYILRIALHFIKPLLFYLMLDKRFHPERRIRASAIGVLGYDDGIIEKWQDYLTYAIQFSTIYNYLNAGKSINADLTDAIQILNTSKDFFFDILKRIFPVDAIAKCSVAFSLLMKDFGKQKCINHIDNFIRRRKTLYRELVKFEKTEAVRPGKCATVDDTKSIMDDYKRKLLTDVKKAIDAASDRIIEAKAPKRKVKFGHEGNGLKGPKTTGMAKQLKAFDAYLAKHPVDDEHSIRTRANECWQQHRTEWNKAAKATGDAKGYSSSKTLAQAKEHF